MAGSSSTEWMWGGGGDFCDEEFSDDCDRSGRSGYYSVEEEGAPWRGQPETVLTSHGPLRVTVCGDRSLPPLVTYHDIALNHSTCFEGLLLCPDTAHLLLGNFCVYHIDAPGHEAGAEEIPPLARQLTASDLADQVADVMGWFRLDPAVCIGVGAGAYILTLLALARPHLVQSLVLVSPLCRAPSWSEWAAGKVLVGLLCFAGMSKYVKDRLVHRYFCQEQTGFHGPASDSILMFRKELDNREAENVMRYLDAIHNRIDLTPFLPHLKCPVLLVAGEMAEASMQEAAHMMCHLDPHTTSWVQVEASGALVTEERPHMLRKPLEAFFARQGMHCVSPFAASLDYCEAVAAASAASSRLSSAAASVASSAAGSRVNSVATSAAASPNSSPCPLPHTYLSASPSSMASWLSAASASSASPACSLSQEYFSKHHHRQASAAASPSSSSPACSPACSCSTSSYSPSASSPRSLLSLASWSQHKVNSPKTFRPEELSISALGVQLKPIRTRATACVAAHSTHNATVFASSCGAQRMANEGLPYATSTLSPAAAWHMARHQLMI